MPRQRSLSMTGMAVLKAIAAGYSYGFDIMDVCAGFGASEAHLHCTGPRSVHFGLTTGHGRHRAARLVSWNHSWRLAASPRLDGLPSPLSFRTARPDPRRNLDYRDVAPLQDA